MKNDKTSILFSLKREILNKKLINSLKHLIVPFSKLRNKVPDIQELSQELKNLSKEFFKFCKLLNEHKRVRKFIPLTVI
jgi:hypothetical protein